MDAVTKEQWALALLTARFDCAQQKFFQAEYGRRRRSPSVALALCLTLGAFGAHEFYMGRLRSAALRLLFCWTVIPALLALFDALFITQRAREYNARMAHTLAEIVEESFAAVRVHLSDDATEPTAWQVGVARTFDAPAPTRWPKDAPSTVPLPEEHVALTAYDAQPSDVPLEHPIAAQPAQKALPAPESEPAHTQSGEERDALSSSKPLRRDWARLGPSLDSLLTVVGAPADEAIARWEDVRTPEPHDVALDTLEVATVAPDEPAQFDALDNEVIALVLVADEYAKMTDTNEPLAAIIGAGPTSVAAPQSRVQRIVVRKVALVDGHPVAEARAHRDVIILGSDDEAQASIDAATEDARAEAMRLLATLVPSETLALASI